MATAAQVDVCRALCVERSWTAVDYLYEDDDHSAFTGRRRPGYERLFADVQGGRFDVVVAAGTEHLWRNPLEQELFLAMGRQTRLELVATPRADILVAETEGLLFRTLVSDLRAAVEELSRLERSADVARLSRMPSSSFPASAAALARPLTEAWDGMAPGERATVLRAVLDDPTVPDRPGAPPPGD